MKLFIRVFIICIFSFIQDFLFAQGFINESFESGIFPPAGWESYNITGTKQWKQVTNVCHSGVACAMIDYESTAGEDILVSPSFFISNGDSISFYMRLNYIGWIPDSLVVKISTTDSLLTSFTNVILNLHEGVNYPTNNTTWFKYSASLNAYAGQSIYFAFCHGDGNGDGIYIDDVFIGSLPPNNVGTTGISILNTSVFQPQIPQATVRNNGSSVQTFNTTMKIGGTYTSTQTVNSLLPGQTATVTFATWTPIIAGIKTVTVFTQLNPDAYHEDDTLKKIVYVQGVLDNHGWISQQAIPKSLIGSGSAFFLNGSLPTDTGYIYVIGGSDLNTNSNTVYRFNTMTNNWDTVAAVPSGKLLASAVTVNKKIYYMGGYDPAFAPQNKTYIYDPSSDNWTLGSNMITAVADYAIGVYKDSLIYIIGGWAGMADINNVQIYNTYTNTWTSGSPKIGYAVDGLRGGISGNNVIVCGGTIQAYNVTIPWSYIGKIDPLNPAIINWKAGPDYPFGSVTRAASGVPYSGTHSMVLFTGGEINGSTSAAYAGTCAYDFDIDAWMIGPNKITPVNLVCDFPGIIKNDTIYNVMISGFDGSNKTPAHEWLNLGASGIVVSNHELASSVNTMNLFQNFPNPCSEQTVIPYFISKSIPVTIMVVDQFGKLIYSNNESDPVPGYHELKLTTIGYSSGVYYYRIISTNFSKTLKMIIIK